MLLHTFDLLLAYLQIVSVFKNGFELVKNSLKTTIPCKRWQRWSDSGFVLSDPILFLKNDIHIRSKSCFGWKHTIRIQKLSESVLWCTTYISVLCLFCLI